MAIVEFELPDEIQGTTYESLLIDMLKKIPNKYDKLEGGFVHDMISPTALEVAELVQFWLPLAVKTNFHMWAKGKWLDFHATNCGLSRRAATSSYGDIQVTTTGKVTFPLGFIFSIPSENNQPAIEFETTEAYSFTEPGTYTLRVKSVLQGKSQNVAGDSISIMKNPVKNVEAITNAEAFTGGTDAEDDDSLRQRIDDFYAGHGASFVGNKKDYERWAKEIAGVGYAHCIPLFAEAWQALFTVTNASGEKIKGNLQLVAGDSPNELKIVADAGTTLTCDLQYTGINSVKIVIADSDGIGCVPEVCEEVETYIFGTSHYDINRLAPVGLVKYEVDAPEDHDILINMDAKIDSEVSLATVKKKIAAALGKYFRTLADENNVFGTLRYTKVSAIISGIDGVIDFKNLTVNGGTDNVDFAEDEIPAITTDNITISTY